MSWRISLLLVLLLGCKPERGDTTPAEKVLAYHNPKALIEAAELRALLDSKEIIIIDVRPEEAYSNGHIPGALRLYRPDMEDENQAVPGIRASREKMEQQLSAMGVSSQHTLILYDNNASCDAARLWWVLNYYGFPNLRILNGGYTYWTQQDLETSMSPEKISPSQFTFPENSNFEHLAHWEEVDALIRNPNTRPQKHLLDVRSADEYSGKRQKTAAQRGGTIPTSNRINWAEATNFHTDHRFKSAEELQRIYAYVLGEDPSEIIVFCHSGVRSAHTTFVLTQLLGYPQVKNYDGSWLEWSAKETLPIQQDSLTVLFQ